MSDVVINRTESSGSEVDSTGVEPIINNLNQCQLFDESFDKSLFLELSYECLLRREITEEGISNHASNHSSFSMLLKNILCSEEFYRVNTGISRKIDALVNFVSIYRKIDSSIVEDYVVTSFLKFCDWKEFVEIHDWNTEISLDLTEDESSAEGRIKGWMLRCLLYTSPSPRDLSTSRMPSSA